jgi:hypothetical protein
MKNGITGLPDSVALIRRYFGNNILKKWTGGVSHDTGYGFQVSVFRCQVIAPLLPDTRNLV